MTHTAVAAPYWRLSAYYFLYFASLGAIIPYWALYLKQCGFNTPQIGLLMAILAGTKIIAPYIWAWIADHSGRRLHLVQWGSVVAAICFTGVYWAESMTAMAVVMFLFSFFWNAGLPQFEAITLHFLGQETHRYSHIRLWGSIGFIMTALCLGPFLDYAGVNWLPHICLALFALIWFSTLHVPGHKLAVEHKSEQRSVWHIVLRTQAKVVLALCFLMQLSFGAYYAFFSIFLQEHGYSKTSVGGFWAVGVLAEIIVLLLMHRLIPRFGPKRLLVFCFTVTALRWFIVGQFVDQAWLVAFSQIMHAFSFGMFHAVMIYLIHQYFAGSLHGRGQALYTSVSFGAGGALGAFVAGGVWDLYGGISAYFFAAAAALFGLALVVFALARHQPVLESN